MFHKSNKYFKNKNFIQKAFYGSNTPLHTIFPGVPEATEHVKLKYSEPKYSTKDGIRIVSIESTSPNAYVTLSFHGGSRVETQENLGASSFIKQFAYKATPNFTQVGITRAIEMNTVLFKSSVSREDISYNASLAKYQVESFFPTLGEITRPKIREFEVAVLESNLVEQSATLNSDPLNLLSDRFHRVAFRGEGLGNSISPFHSRLSLDHAQWVEVLHKYVSNYFVRERAVLVGVGVSSEQLEAHVSSYLSVLPSGKDAIPRTQKYYGGEHFGDGYGDTHLIIGFEGLPIINPKIHALNLIYTLLGGGCKLAREFPGNGRTSILNQELVEKMPSVVTASTFNSNYRDTGLFGIYLRTTGENASVIDNLCQQIHSLSKLNASQLESAKKQLKMQLSLYYDCNEKRAELAKRFLLAGMDPISSQNFISQVDNITLEDINSVLKHLTSSKPILIAEGNITGVVGVDQITRNLSNVTR